MSEPALRILVVILCGVAGLGGVTLQRGGDPWGILGALVGLLFGLLLLLLERQLRRVPGRTILQALLGLLLGLLVGRLASAVLTPLLVAFPADLEILLHALCLLGGGYLGLKIFLEHQPPLTGAGTIATIRAGACRNDYIDVPANATSLR